MSIAILLLPTSANAAPRQETLAEIGARVDSLVQRQMTLRQIDGASLVVIHKGRVINMLATPTSSSSS